MGNFAYRQVLKELNINRLGPTAHAGPYGQDRTKPHGAGLAKSPTAHAGLPHGAGLAKKPHFHALQASDAPFFVDEEIVTGAQEFVFV